MTTPASPAEPRSEVDRAGRQRGPRISPRSVTGLHRADLTFYGLDHSGPSYERGSSSTPRMRRRTLRWNAPPATSGRSPCSVTAVASASTEHGHCDVRGPVTAFDRRLPHQLVPASRVLLCTEALRARLGEGRDHVTVTVVPVVRSPLATATQAEEVLQIETRYRSTPTTPTNSAPVLAASSSTKEVHQWQATPYRTCSSSPRGICTSCSPPPASTASRI